MSAGPPPKKLKWGRVLAVLVVVGGAGFAGYWFGFR